MVIALMSFPHFTSLEEMKPENPLVACEQCVMNTLTDHAQDIPEMALLLMSIRGMKIAQ